jgi:hypothetical protein
MMLCAIPLFALVLKVLYLRRHILYIDHLVYALHVHTFLYIAITLITLTGMGLNRVAPNLTTPVCNIFSLAASAQIFLSIRRVYLQSWLISVVKFLSGGFVYLIVLLIAFVTTFFVTLAMG